ncbi:hypothetical protein J2Z66_004032 [Paenibacillus eucommiae]|uniref:SDR family oxidoreductase n=2 Tax=Paenibacillus eucommiae TaxID=1355755 RepID=A0ABS4IXW3_9BACL|nr:hypothetical protein [Paenibacillus eucommiae]
MKNNSLIGRSGRPNEINEVAAFLLSDAASYVTGSSYPVTGGCACENVKEPFNGLMTYTRKKVAVIITEYRLNSHAEVIVAEYVPFTH